MLRFKCELSGSEATGCHTVEDAAGWRVAVWPQEAESIRTLTPSHSDVCPKQSNELKVPLSMPLHSLTSCGRLVCFCWLPSVYSRDIRWWAGDFKTCKREEDRVDMQIQMDGKPGLGTSMSNLRQAGRTPLLKGPPATSLTCLPWILYLMMVSLTPPS